MHHIISIQIAKLRNTTERNARNFIKLWMGRAVLSAFSGWAKAVAIAKVTRLRAARFGVMRGHRLMASVWRALKTNTRDEARVKFVLARVRTRWSNVHMWKVGPLIVTKAVLSNAVRMPALDHSVRLLYMRRARGEDVQRVVGARDRRAACAFGRRALRGALGEPDVPARV